MIYSFGYVKVVGDVFDRHPICSTFKNILSAHPDVPCAGGVDKYVRLDMSFTLSNILILLNFM